MLVRLQYFYHLPVPLLLSGSDRFPLLGPLLLAGPDQFPLLSGPVQLAKLSVSFGSSARRFFITPDLAVRPMFDRWDQHFWFEMFGTNPSALREFLIWIFKAAEINPLAKKKSILRKLEDSHVFGTVLITIVCTTGHVAFVHHGLKKKMFGKCLKIVQFNQTKAILLVLTKISG